MRLRSILLTFLVSVPSAVAQEAGTVYPSASSAQNFQALVVTQLDKNGEAAKSGLRNGDILLKWSGNSSGGLLNSPFDLSTIEIEQRYSGSISLEGLRGAQRKTWSLGAGAWGIQTRPDYPENLLSLYDEGLQFATVSNWPRMFERWHSMTNPTSAAVPRWLREWLFLRAAGLLSEARQWQAADDAFKEALQNERVNETVKAQIMRAWGKSFELRSDWPRAEARYQEALENDSRLNPENLAVAIDLSSLGSAALARSDLPKAESYFQKSLKIREDHAPGSLPVAASLYDLGLAAFYRSDLDKAQKYFQQSLELREKLSPGSLDAATSFTGLATVANYRGNQITAKEYYLKALEIHERLAPDGIELTRDLFGLGNVAYDLGDLAGAEEYFRRSYLIREKLAPGSLDVAKSLISLANVSYDLGNLTKAAQYYNQAYEIREKVAPGSLDVAKSLAIQAIVARDRGDLSDAESYGYRALEIQKKLSPDSLDMASTLNNLGIVFYDRGDLAKAEKYYLQSLAITQQKAPESLNFAHRLTNLGRIALDNRDYDKANLYFRQSLAIKEKQSLESLEVASGLNNLGEVAAHQKDWSNAEDLYHKALKIREKLSPRSRDMAWNLNCLGALALNQGQFVTAEIYFGKALELWTIFSPGSRNHAETLAELGEIKYRQGQKTEAADFFQQAIDAIENQAIRLGGGQEIRAGFRSRFESYYKDYIELLIAMDKPELAFQVLERSRARTLLETLATAHVDIQKGVEPALLQQEHSLEADINAKLERRTQLLSKKNAAGPSESVEKELDKLQLQYRDIQARIRTSTPGYAALMKPQELTVQAVQQRLLDSNTVLLEYALGNDSSYVFFVTEFSFAVYKLPKRSEIENAARKVHDLLASRNNAVLTETALQRQEQWNRIEMQYSEAAIALAAMVFDPVATLLKAKRVLIVADGALQYVPFAALPNSTRLDTETSAQNPMLLDYEIINLPSASVLDVLRSEAPKHQPSRKMIAVLADPVFDKHDIRITGRSGPIQSGARGAQQAAAADDAPPHNDADSSALEANDLASRSAGDVGLDRSGQPFLPRLLFSRKEAAAILAVTPKGQGKELLDFSASRAAATSPELSKYSIIHFATHGLLE